MKTEIEIPVSALKTALPGLGKIIGRRSSLPVLSCVKVSLDVENTIKLQANNLDEIATATVGQCSSGTSGEILVPMEELAMLAKNGSESFRLVSDDKKSLVRYRAAGTTIEKPFPRLDPAEWPPCVNPKVEPIALDDAFKEALKEALECASTDSSRYVLNGTCLDVSKKEAHYVVASNGCTLYTANSFLFDLPESLIIPNRKFLVWPGFMGDGNWQLRFQPGTEKNTGAWLQIDSDHWSYIAKPIEGNYPEWKEALPVTDDRWTRITLGEEGVKTILEAIPLLPGANGNNQPIVLEVSDQKLFLKAKGDLDSDWSTIPIAVAEIKGKPVEILLNRQYLAKALGFGTTTISIQDPITRVLFSTDRKSFVVLPLKGEAAEKFEANQNASAAKPSTAEVQPTTEKKRTTMPKSESAEATVPTAAKPACAFEQVQSQIEVIRDTLKTVITQLNDSLKTITQAYKEKKATEKEIESIRESLKEIQRIRI